jgi:hypothetical protein
VRLPSAILKHWNTHYSLEVRCNVPGIRCFRFDQIGRSAVRPHDQLQHPVTFDYCTTCAIPEHEDKLVGAVLVAETKVNVRALVEEREHVVEKTIQQLATEEPPEQAAQPAPPVSAASKPRPNLCVEATKIGKISLDGDIWTLRPNTRSHIRPNRALLPLGL